MGDCKAKRQNYFLFPSSIENTEDSNMQIYNCYGQSLFKASGLYSGSA